MKHFYLLTALLAGLHSAAQSPFTFSERFDGSGDDEYTSAIPVNGGYFAAGYTWGAPYGGLATKFDNTGAVIWSKTVGGTRINRCVQSATGMYFVAGENSVSGNPNFYLAKLNGSGNLQWAKTFGKTSEPDVLRDLRLTSDGGCLLCGYADTVAGAGFTPIAYIIKTDSSGNIQWAKYVGGAQGEEFYTAKELSGGGFLACGYTHSYGSQVGNENYLVRFDASGNAIWKQVFGHASRFDYITDFIEAPGGFLVTGNCTYGSATDNAFLAKTDLNGNMIWIKSYSTGAGTSHLLRLSDGNLAMAGYNTDATLGLYNNSYLIKTDTSGNILFSRQYGLSGEDDRILSARETSDGGFICSGSIYNLSTNLRAAWIMKTDAAGVSGCRDTSWNVVVTNLPVSSTSGGNTVNVTYSNTSTTAQLNTSLASTFMCANTSVGIAETENRSADIFPNPAIDFLHVQSGKSSVIIIRNLQGICVATYQSAASPEQVIPVGNLAAGLYLLEIREAGEQHFFRFIKAE